MKSTHRAFYVCVALSLITILLLFAITITRYYNRAWSIESQSLAQKNDQLKIDWERMQLEHNAYKTQSRIEAIVRDELEMKSPQAQEIYRLGVDDEAR